MFQCLELFRVEDLGVGCYGVGFGDSGSRFAFRVYGLRVTV